MDLQKIGSFLKELRKEKELTQEQLAETLNVSRRTVSRWETGSNMPDLDLLVEMADLYQVDLRELLDGERKKEQMDTELKETVLQVAEYSNEEKSRLNQRMHWLLLAGLAGFCVFIVINLLGMENTPPYEGIASFGLGAAFGLIVLGVVFTGKYASRIHEFKLRMMKRLKENRK